MNELPADKKLFKFQSNHSQSKQLNTKYIKDYLLELQLSHKHLSNFAIDIYEKIPSTITLLENKFLEINNYYLCLAEQQTQGQGQLGRHWYSPYGLNIYLSLGFVVTNTSLDNISNIGLITGVALIEALQEYGITDNYLKIKWPNDIFYHDEKLAGILINSQNANNNTKDKQIIISIGLNVNMDKQNHNINEQYQSELTQPWTSIRHVFSKPILHDRNYIVALIIKNLLPYLEQVFNKETNQTLSNSLPILWQKNDYLYQKNITIFYNNYYYTGICQGINSQGNLQLQNEQNHILTFSSGKVILLN